MKIYRSNDKPNRRVCKCRRQGGVKSPVCRLTRFAPVCQPEKSMNNQYNVSKRKTRQTANQQKLTDLFTSIVKADLGETCVKEYRFHPQRRWRFDYALPEHKIALEVEGGVWTGGRHTRPQGFLGDIEKYNTATLMGWRVFRTTPEELVRSATLNLLRQAISGKLQS